MRLIRSSREDGEHTAVNPAEIEHVNGRGRTFTAYMRSGAKVTFHNTNTTVGEFIDLWDRALAAAQPPAPAAGPTTTEGEVGR